MLVHPRVAENPSTAPPAGHMPEQCAPVPFSRFVNGTRIGVWKRQLCHSHPRVHASARAPGRWELCTCGSTAAAVVDAAPHSAGMLSMVSAPCRACTFPSETAPPPARDAKAKSDTGLTACCSLLVLHPCLPLKVNPYGKSAEATAATAIAAGPSRMWAFGMLTRL